MIEAMKQALEALEQVTKELLAVRDELAERGARPTTNVFHQRLWNSSFSAYTDHAIPAAQSLRKAIAELESQKQGEPVACKECHLKDTVYDLLGDLKVANLKLSVRSQRTWVGLTDEERNHARQTVTYSQLAMTAAEWAEAVQIETERRLKEKNK